MWQSLRLSIWSEKFFVSAASTSRFPGKQIWGTLHDQILFYLALEINDCLKLEMHAHYISAGDHHQSCQIWMCCWMHFRYLSPKSLLEFLINWRTPQNDPVREKARSVFYAFPADPWKIFSKHFEQLVEKKKKKINTFV